MTRLLHAVSGVVERRPGFTVALILLLTVVFGVFAGRATQSQGFESFAPDNEVAAAAARIEADFADTQAAFVAQLAVVAPAGGDVLDAAGVATALDVRATLLSDPAFTAVLLDEPARPGLVTFADPVLGAAAQAGLDPGSLDDGTVDALFTQVVGALPLEARGQVTALLSTVEGARADAGVVVAFLDPEAGRDDLLAAREALAALDGTRGDLELYALDFELMSEQVNATIEREMGTLLGVAFLLIVLILVAIYRRASDVIASLLGLVFSIVWVQGLATLLGPGYLGLTGGMSEMAMIIPILLIGLGVDYGIHLTMRYREERDNGADPDGAAAGAVKAVGTALMLATITTVVGFLTNVTNPLPPLQDFGVFAAVGVIGAFVIMTTWVPAVRLLLDRRRAARGTLPDAASAEHGPTFLGRLTAGLAPTAVRRPGTVLAVAGVLTLAGLGGASQLSTEFSQTEFFPEGSRALATIDTFTQRFGGDLGETTDVLIEGDVSAAPSRAAVEAFLADLADDPDVRSDGSVAQAQVLEPTTPTDAVVVRVNTTAADQVERLVVDLHQDAAPLRAAGLTVTFSSQALLIDQVMSELEASQIKGLGLTLVGSMLILALAFWVKERQPLLGVLAIGSVGVVVAWVLGLMALLGIPFNVMTAMVSSLAIGIGVPFGIHVVNRFLEDRALHPALDDAMRQTLLHTGGALVGSAVTTVAGFGVLTLASIRPMQQFGLVTALTIALALLSSIVVLPAMLALWARRADRRSGDGADLQTEVQRDAVRA